MNETEKMFEITQKTYDLVEGIFGSYNNLNKLYENSIKDYDEQNNRLKEAFDNAQKNLEEIQKIKESNTTEISKIEAILKDQSLITESVKQVQKSINDFNAQFTLDQKDMNNIKTEIVIKKKEIIDSITSKINELQNQKDDILRLIKSFSNVAIEGTDVTVMSNGNTTHYKFEDGVVLDGVDFINEKADNGVDKIIDKVQNLSTLNVGNGVRFSNNYNNNKSGSYFLFAEEARIGFYDSDNHQNTMTINLSGTTFSNDIFVGDKKVLLEGDVFNIDFKYNPIPPTEEEIQKYDEIILKIAEKIISLDSTIEIGIRQDSSEILKDIYQIKNKDLIEKAIQDFPNSFWKINDDFSITLQDKVNDFKTDSFFKQKYYTDPISILKDTITGNLFFVFDPAYSREDALSLNIGLGKSVALGDIDNKIHIGGGKQSVSFYENEIQIGCGETKSQRIYLGASRVGHNVDIDIGTSQLNASSTTNHSINIGNEGSNLTLKGKAFTYNGREVLLK